MIDNIFIIAFAVYSIKATTWKKHIFEKQGNWLKENLPEKIYKPLIGCNICMTPWWGTVMYLVADVCGIPSFQDARWFMIIATVLPAMGVNAFIVKIIPKKQACDINSPVRPAHQTLSPPSL